MATRPLHGLPPAATFPAPGVAASLQRAITAAGQDGGDRQPQTARIETLRNLDGAGHAFPARRLRVARLETPRSPARASARSEPA